MRMTDGGHNRRIITHSTVAYRRICANQNMRYRLGFFRRPLRPWRNSFIPHCTGSNRRYPRNDKYCSLACFAVCRQNQQPRLGSFSQIGFICDKGCAAKHTFFPAGCAGSAQKTHTSTPTRSERLIDSFAEYPSGTIAAGSYSSLAPHTQPAVSE